MAKAKPTRAERREAYEHEKVLNKPGRVGSFAEWERDRKITEREEQQDDEKKKRQYITVEQPLKLPGAAFLIALGLFVLWLAVSGDFTKLAQAYDYVRGHRKSLASNGGDPSCDLSHGICNFDSYHVNSMMIQPDISATVPGGLT